MITQVETFAEGLVRIIRQQRLDLSTEKRLQSGLADVFLNSNIAFSREHALSPGDIPDFFMDHGVLIECKVHGAKKMDVYKQLCRYAEHDEVSAIILASNISMGMPALINGKPVFCASLSRGWL